jgi:tripartite-type tricarboxylate transporter receptor subunit TctC
MRESSFVRTFRRFAGGLLFGTSLIAGLLASDARADDYPSRPITIITSVPPGGSVDALARVTAEKLREKFGQPVVVENRPGASGNIGIGAVERAAPDGYTFLFNPGAHLVVNKILFPTASSDPDNLEPVSRIATNPVVLAVHPQVPAKTLQEFVAYAKANPGKLNYASAGNGGMPHLSAEMFQTKADVKMTKVTFRGVAPAMVGLVAGQVDLIFVDISTALPHIQSGRLRVFGVASEKRHPVLPDTPALAEVYSGLTSETWFALSAPPKTPPEIVKKISAAVAEGIRKPDVQQRMKTMGNIEAVGSTPEQMAAFIREERARWGAVIRSLGESINN